MSNSVTEWGWLCKLNEFVLSDFSDGCPISDEISIFSYINERIPTYLGLTGIQA